MNDNSTSRSHPLREEIARTIWYETHDKVWEDAPFGTRWFWLKVADAVLALPQGAELRGKAWDSDGDLFAQIDAVLGSGDYGNVTDRLVEFVEAREAELRGRVVNDMAEVVAKALQRVTDEEADAVDFAMSEHMYHHSISNNINRMGCDAGCRTRGLRKAVDAVLSDRRAALASDPTTHESADSVRGEIPVGPNQHTRGRCLCSQTHTMEDFL